MYLTEELKFNSMGSQILLWECAVDIAVLHKLDNETPYWLEKPQTSQKNEQFCFTLSKYLGFLFHPIYIFITQQTICLFCSSYGGLLFVESTLYRTHYILKILLLKCFWVEEKTLKEGNCFTQE